MKANTQNHAKNHIVIIGGTSGIGLALAERHLAQDWQVSIIGSNRDKVHTLQQQYRDNAHMTIMQADITSEHDRKHLYDYLNTTPFNRLIYAAGEYFNERKSSLNANESEQVLAVNLQTFGDVFYKASECLKRHQKDNPNLAYHLVAIASVAGLLHFRGASLYAKCKAAMISVCNAYRSALIPFGIAVVCIASGYVDTDKLRALNGGRADNKPFLCSVDRAVDEIEHAITQNKAIHIFPKRMKYLVRALTILPMPILDKVMALQYRK